MPLGVVFTQTESPADPVALRDYAQTVEGLGLSYLDAYDHVLGANPNRPGGWPGPYTFESSFLEPFVLFSYVARFTTKVRLCTNITIPPPRPPALAPQPQPALA